MVNGARRRILNELMMSPRKNADDAPLRARPVLGGLARWAVLAAAGMLAAGCADLGFDDNPTGGRADDGDQDGGVGGDGGEAEAPGADDRSGFTPTLPPDFADNAPSDLTGDGFCFVGREDDPRALECSDSSCVFSGACCVGLATCCAPVPGSTLGAVFDLCADGAAAPCVADAAAFGAVAPVVADGVFFARGDVDGDSGLQAGEPFTLASARKDLGVTFQVGACDGPCLETAGVGLVGADEVGVDASLTPRVALVARGADETVRLLIGGVEAASWEASALGDGEWTLELGGGAVTVLFSAAPGGEPRVALMDNFDASGTLAAVLYGRNLGTPGADSTGIESFSFSDATCDAPTEWSSRAPLAFEGDAPASPDGAALAAAGDETFVAYADGGAIFVGVLSGTTVTGASVAIPTDLPFDYAAGGVSDPELVRAAGDDGWHLFFTARAEDGTASIGRASRADSASSWSVREAPVLAAAELEGATEVEAPSVLRYSTGELLLVVGVRDGASSWLEVRKSSAASDGVDWRHLNDDVGDQASASSLAGFTRRDGTSMEAAFDRDEVARPALHEQNRAFHVYYAGRRGSRWGIGLLTSDDLLRWRHVGDGAPALAHDGAGFDAFGVDAPDAVHDGDEVRVVFLGDSGAAKALGIATRPAPGLAIQSRPRLPLE